MRSQEFRVDVTGRTGLSGELSTTATIYLPDRLIVPATVIFAFPGSGLTRHYFDIDAAVGYSQAHHHVSDGLIFVSCDHVGTGDSTGPDPQQLDHENMAAANHASVTTLVGALQGGSLVDGLPPIALDKVIGLGHAFGACLLTVQQARHATFDAIALLGWSAIATGFPLPDPDDERAESVLAAGQLATHGSEAAFAPPWRDTRVPPCVVRMFRPRIVSADAAAISVPVLLASGERDAVSDPWTEPSAYRSSMLVTVCVIEGMAQMHNFAAARTELWDRISDFAHIVRPRVLRPRRVLTEWTQRATPAGW
jgi:hypothetical protein